MKETSRRNFLKGTAATLAISSLGPFSAFCEEDLFKPLSKKERILIVVQLQGGNDGLNTVIPYSNPLYAQNRRILGIPKSSVLTLDGNIGFHPSLSGFHNLYKKGKLAVIQGVGYPYPNRSHFRSTEIWQTAKSDVIDIRSGWIGRCADSWAKRGNSKFTACSIGNQEQPLSLVGLKSAPPTIQDANSFKIHLNNPGSKEARDRLSLLQDLAEIPRDKSTNLEFVRQQTQSAFSAARSVEEIIRKNPNRDYGSDLGRKLGVASAMIRGGLATRIYHISMGGFDTHANQKNGHGALLRQVDQAISNFYQDLEKANLSDQVAVMVYSEFGRRVQENRSGGTDHGAAAPMFLISGGVRGGIIGEHPALDDLDDGDLKMQIDFRSVYRTLIDGWLDLNASQILAKRYPTVNLFG